VASFVGVGICQEGPGPMNKRVRTQAIPSVTAGANVLGPREGAAKADQLCGSQTLSTRWDAARVVGEIEEGVRYHL
jgi:hypothetical protein